MEWNYGHYSFAIMFVISYLSSYYGSQREKQNNRKQLQCGDNCSSPRIRMQNAEMTADDYCSQLHGAAFNRNVGKTLYVI